jgi:hypothetical protein
MRYLNANASLMALASHKVNKWLHFIAQNHRYIDNGDKFAGP